MRKKLLAIILALVMCLSLLPVTAVAAPETAEAVPYVERAWNETDGVTKEDNSAVNYTVVTDSNEGATWVTGFYVVQGNVNITGDITLNGDVNLILCDGANLNVNGTISGEDYSLTIYGQEDDSGNLNVAAESDSAIVNAVKVKGLTVHGGIVNATATVESDSDGGVGIFGETVTLYGGTVSAAGNGGGSPSGLFAGEESGTLTVRGGSLTAKANATGSGQAKGISTTNYYDETVIEISGGSVVAIGTNGTDNNYGIYNENNNVLISGGEVSAMASGNASATGINLGSGKITVAGGSVAAIGENTEDAYGIISTKIDIQGGSVAAVGDAEGDNSYGYGLYYFEEFNISGGSIAAKGIGGVENKAMNSKPSSIGGTPTLTVGGVPFAGQLIGDEESVAIQYKEELDGGETYVKRSWDETTSEVKEVESALEILEDATPVTSSDMDVEWSEGTYVVTGDTAIAGNIILTGDVKLILCDDATLTVLGQITDNKQSETGEIKFSAPFDGLLGAEDEGGTLTIYGQDGDSGLLHVWCEDNSENSVATAIRVHGLTMHGGTVVASGSGCNGFGVLVEGHYTVPEGEFDVVSITPAKMEVFGGSLTASGDGTDLRELSQGYYYNSAAAGIWVEGKVTIYDGAVTADGSNSAIYEEGKENSAVNTYGICLQKLTSNEILDRPGRNFQDVYACLTVHGGRLRATGDAATSAAWFADGYAVYVKGNCTIGSGNVTAVGNGNSYGYGIYLGNLEGFEEEFLSELTIKGGTVTAIGNGNNRYFIDDGNHGTSSCGIAVEGKCAISGGEVTATGNSYNDASWGIGVGRENPNSELTLSGNSTVTAIANGYEQSKAILVTGDINIRDNSKVTAIGNCNMPEGSATGIESERYITIGGESQVTAIGNCVGAIEDEPLSHFFNAVGIYGNIRTEFLDPDKSTTLTIQDNSVVTAKGNSIFVAYGISNAGQMLVSNSSTVTAAAESSCGMGYGINTYVVNPNAPDALTVEGNAEVTASGVSRDGQSCGGIYLSGDLNIQGGSVEVTGSNTGTHENEESLPVLGAGIGIWIDSHFNDEYISVPSQVKVSGDGNLTVNGSSEYGTGYGIYLNALPEYDEESGYPESYSYGSVSVDDGTVSLRGSGKTDGYAIGEAEIPTVEDDVEERPEPTINHGTVSVTKGELKMAGSQQALSSGIVVNKPDTLSIMSGANMDGSGAAEWDGTTALDSYKYLHITVGTGDDDEGGCALLRLLRAALVTKLTVCSIVCGVTSFVRMTARIAAAENAYIGAATRAMWTAAHMAWLANAWHLWH